MSPPLAGGFFTTDPPGLSPPFFPHPICHLFLTYPATPQPPRFFTHPMSAHGTRYHPLHPDNPLPELRLSRKQSRGPHYRVMLDGGDVLTGQEGEGEGELCQASRDCLGHSSAGHRGHLRQDLKPWNSPGREEQRHGVRSALSAGFFFHWSTCFLTRN